MGLVARGLQLLRPFAATMRTLMKSSSWCRYKLIQRFISCGKVWGRWGSDCSVANRVVSGVPGVPIITPHLEEPGVIRLLNLFSILAIKVILLANY